MGDTALVTSEEESTEGEIEVEGDEESLSENENPPEVEVVLQNGDGSQPSAKKHFGVSKRINKLNEKNKVSEDKASQATADLAHANEIIKVQQIALDQKKESEALKPPNPDDFDDGVSDPGFIQAQNKHTQDFIASELKKATANFPTRQDEPATNTDLLNRQKVHYEAAEEFGASDYAEVEDKALEILGNDTVNFIIQCSEASPVILYYLGKNPDKAEDLAELVKSNLGKATLQIGRLEANCKIQPKANDEPTPNPDDELNGGTPSASNSKELKLERQLDKIRDDVSNGTKTMRDIIAFKRKAKADGVTLK